MTANIEDRRFVEGNSAAMQSYNWDSTLGQQRPRLGEQKTESGQHHQHF